MPLVLYSGRRVPRQEITRDEMAYTLSRLKFRLEEESEESGPGKAPADCPAPLDFIGESLSEEVA